MQTQDQRAEQARTNGAKSTGPKTEAGKERIASANTRRAQRDELLRLLVPPHHTVFCTEDRKIYYDLLDSYIAKYRATDNVELEVVGEIVSYAWRMKRLAVIETGLWNRELIRQGPLTGAAEPELHPLENLINTTEGLAENDRTLRKIARDRAECVRLIAATERRFVRLRRHFPSQGINIIISADEREPFHVEPAAVDASSPTEVVENKKQAPEKDTHFRTFEEEPEHPEIVSKLHNQDSEVGDSGQFLQRDAA